MAQLTTPFSLILTPLASRISCNTGIRLHSSPLLGLLAWCLPFCAISKGRSGPRLPPCTHPVNVHSPGNLTQPHGSHRLYTDDSQVRPPSTPLLSILPKETHFWCLWFCVVLLCFTGHPFFLSPFLLNRSSSQNGFFVFVDVQSEQLADFSKY